MSLSPWRPLSKGELGDGGRPGRCGSGRCAMGAVALTRLLGSGLWALLFAWPLRGELGVCLHAQCSTLAGSGRPAAPPSTPRTPPLAVGKGGFRDEGSSGAASHASCLCCAFRRRRGRPMGTGRRSQARIKPRTLALLPAALHPLHLVPVLCPPPGTGSRGPRTQLGADR